MARELEFVGSAREDLRAFPPPVRHDIGAALYLAQLGSKHTDAKPLKGFSGAGVLEIVENHDGNTYRAVYTLRFTEVVYVLHAFQKKSKQGVSTPKVEISLIQRRLKLVREQHARRRKQ